MKSEEQSRVTLAESQFVCRVANPMGWAHYWCFDKYSAVYGFFLLTDTGKTEGPHGEKVLEGERVTDASDGLVYDVDFDLQNESITDDETTTLMELAPPDTSFTCYGTFEACYDDLVVFYNESRDTHDGYFAFPKELLTGDAVVSRDEYYRLLEKGFRWFSREGT